MLTIPNPSSALQPTGRPAAYPFTQTRNPGKETLYTFLTLVYFFHADKPSEIASVATLQEWAEQSTIASNLIKGATGTILDVITPSLAFGFELRITGRDHNQIKDYLSELFDEVLRHEVLQYGAIPHPPNPTHGGDL